MLHELTKTTRNRKRRGRGNAAGRGTYAGRGVKGQNSRSGGGVRPGFEGGRTPLARILPKRRGLKQRPVNVYVPINLSRLSHYEDGEVVSLKSLKKKGIVAKSTKSVKILGNGDLKKKVVFAFPTKNFSQEAIAKIEKAGAVMHKQAEPAKDKKSATKKSTKKSDSTKTEKSTQGK